MKSIELTEEHKSKLLEMCNKLFPEYSEIYWNSGKGSNGSSEHLGFGTPTEENPNFNNYIYIHWFEFCMTYLIEKLNDKYHEVLKEKSWEEFPPYVSNVYSNAKGKWNLYTKFHFHYPKACNGGSNFPINPIDYLYEEFKKLKQ